MRLVYQPDDVLVRFRVPGLPRQPLLWADVSERLGPSHDVWAQVSDAAKLRPQLNKLPLNRSCCNIDDKDVVDWSSCSSKTPLTPFLVNFTARALANWSRAF